MPETRQKRTPGLQDRILDATITLLSQRGYGATSLKHVAAEAGLSLGSVQHQFATRADLMVAVMQTAIDQNEVEFLSSLKGARTIEDIVSGSVGAGWRIVTRPSFIASFEIALGTRSDPSLAQHTSAALQEADRRGMEVANTVGRDLGISTKPLDATFRLLYRAMMRGLALDVAQGTPEPQIHEALHAFEQMMIDHVRRAEATSAPDRNQ